jgi:hypothetical protein
LGNHGISKATPVATEATDVAHESIRSFGKRDSPNMDAIRRDFQQDTLELGGQFDDGHDSDVMDLEDGEDRLQQTLEERLWDARIEWPKGDNRYFIPADVLQSLVTVESIYSELVRCRIKMQRDEILDTSKRIWKAAPRIFAILVCMNKGRCIINFLNEGLEDEDLPFKRSEIKEIGAGANNFKLRSRRHDGKRINSMSNWGRSEITTFGRDQWWMLAPIFKEGKTNRAKVRHWDLEDNCVLPFIEDTKRTKVKESGFSSVWGVLIHPAHQLLYKSTNPKVRNPKSMGLATLANHGCDRRLKTLGSH